MLICSVFGPNILRPIGFDVNVMIEDSGYANEAVTFMINHYDSLFDVAFFTKCY